MTMQFEQTASSRVKNFYEKAKKPAAIIDTQGMFIQVNDEFKERINAKPIENIKTAVR